MAIQIASQSNCWLTFFHCCHLTKPESPAGPVFELYEKSEFTVLKTKLNDFVHSVYKSLHVVPDNTDCVVKSSSFPDTEIMSYAVQHAYNFICMSWSGGGNEMNSFGPNTFNLITKSTTPVIAVPDNYRRSKITTILYASDLLNVETEIRKIVEFAKPLHAKIEVLHFNVLSDPLWDIKRVEKAAKQLSNYHLDLHTEHPDSDHTFIFNLEQVIRKSKPSMLIMFRHQNRNFFEHFFTSGRQAKYLFKAEIPMLVFKKN